MAKDRSRVPPPITPADLDRFHRNAQAALERRGGRFFLEQWLYSFELILMGAGPIVGMLAFGWTADALLLFLLVAIWIAIACDLAKYLLLKPVVRREAEVYTDDHHVWVVSEALRENKREAPAGHLTAAYLPGVGLCLDLLLGGVAGAVIILVVRQALPEFPFSLLGDQDLLLGLLGFTLYEVLSTAWLVADHRLGAKRPVQLHAGLRGIGLLGLMLVALLLSEDLGHKAASTTILMLVANGFVVLGGLLNIVGMKLVRNETVWLREYLQQRKQTVPNASQSQEGTG